MAVQSAIPLSYHDHFRAREMYRVSSFSLSQLTATRQTVFSREEFLSRDKAEQQN